MTAEMIHRLSNGTVDIDACRQRALCESAAVMTATFGRAGPLVRPAIAMLVVMATIWALPAPRPAIDASTLALSAAAKAPADRINSVRQ